MDNSNVVFYYLLPTYLKLLHDGVAIVRNKAAACTNLVLKAVCGEARKVETSPSTSAGDFSPTTETAGTATPSTSVGGSSAPAPSTSVVATSSSPHGPAVSTTTPDHHTGIPSDSSSRGGQPPRSPAHSSDRGGHSSSNEPGGGQSQPRPSSDDLARHSSNAHLIKQSFYSPRTRRIVNHIKRTFRDGSFQQKITFIKMTDSLIRDSGVRRKFVHVFLSPLAELAFDRIRHVRLQWALIVGPHLKPNIGKCCYHRKLLAAGRTLQGSSDIEIKRALSFPLADDVDQRLTSLGVSGGAAFSDSGGGARSDRDDQSSDLFSDAETLSIHSPAGSVSSSRVPGEESESDQEEEGGETKDGEKDGDSAVKSEVDAIFLTSQKEAKTEVVVAKEEVEQGPPDKTYKLPGARKGGAEALVAGGGKRESLLGSFKKSGVRDDEQEVDLLVEDLSGSSDEERAGKKPATGAPVPHLTDFLADEGSNSSGDDDEISTKPPPDDPSHPQHQPPSPSSPMRGPGEFSAKIDASSPRGRSPDRTLSDEEDAREAWPTNVATPLHEKEQYSSSLLVPDVPLPPSDYDKMKSRSKEEDANDDV